MKKYNKYIINQIIKYVYLVFVDNGEKVYNYGNTTTSIK